MRENYTKEIIIPILFFWSSFSFICVLVCECLLPFLRKRKNIKFKIFHLHVFYKVILFCCHFYFIMYERELYASQQLYLMYAACSAFVYIVLRQRNYSNAEINLSLKDSESIGALWAHHTYDAYYKIVLEEIMDRMEKFEEKYNVNLFIKKLLLVIPLSCDIEGTFAEKDPSIEEFGNLEIVENDAGGNINRMFKNPVFKIRKIQDVYIVAEFSQPVSTLWRSQYLLKEKNFNYIRDCYVKTLKLLLQRSSCILVLHDDVKGSQTLSDCILSTIEKERRDFIV